MAFCYQLHHIPSMNEETNMIENSYKRNNGISSYQTPITVFSLTQSTTTPKLRQLKPQKKTIRLLAQPQAAPLIPPIPAAMKRGLLIQAVLGPAPDLFLLLHTLLRRLEAARSMNFTKAVHVDGLNADPGTAVAVVCGADAVAGVFFALAPLVKREVLATHG